MQLLAKREKLNVAEVITESHSAKESGQRSEFNKLLQELGEGKFNAILTWVPDRPSRNAGDLGRIVDLISFSTKNPAYSKAFCDHSLLFTLQLVLLQQRVAHSSHWDLLALPQRRK